MLKIPVSGKSTMGSIEVTGMGAASVIHQVIIQAATPITFHASSDRRSAGTRTGIRKKSKGPKRRPNILAPVNCGCFKTYGD